jgi:hypothetical protein
MRSAPRSTIFTVEDDDRDAEKIVVDIIDKVQIILFQ